MSMQTKVLFWRLAFYFVVEQEYTIARMNQEHTEMWLENRTQKKVPIVRLSEQNLGWGAALGREIKQLASYAEKIRRQTGGRRFSVLNLVVSPHLPIDDYDQYVEPVQAGKTNVETILFTKEELLYSLKKLEVLVSPVPELRDFEGEEDEAAAYERAVLSHEVKRKEEENRFFHFGKPFFTYVFTVINIAMFVLMTMAGGSTQTNVLIQFGAKFNPLILEGEWWRFFTPMFLHIGLLHLVMNSLALFYLGTAVEQIYGRLRFLWIYLFSGFTGSLLSFLLTPNLSAGASGAIFGLFGALLYFGVTKPKLFFRTIGANVLMVIGINLAFGFTVPGIDNAGHIGGLIGGFLATGIVHFPAKRRSIQQVAFSVITAMAVASALILGFQNGYAAIGAEAVNVQVMEEIRKGNEEKAEQIIAEFIEEGGNPSAEMYFYLAYVQMGKNELESAESNLKKALAERPTFHQAHYNLSLLYAQQGNLAEARKSAAEALQLNPGNDQYKEWSNQLNNQ